MTDEAQGSAIALCLIMLASPLAGYSGEQNNAGPNSVDDVTVTPAIWTGGSSRHHC